MLLKEYWPTAEKIQSLRTQGIVPYSTLATKLFIILVIIVSFAAQKDKIRDLLSWQNWIAAASLEQIFLRISQLGTVILVFASTVAVAILFLGLLQNLFLFRPGFVAFRAERFKRGKTENLLLALIKQLSSIVIASITCLTLIYLVAPTLIRLFSFGVADFINIGPDDTSALIMIVSLLLMLGIVIAILSTHLLFRVRHQMTREEYKAEQEG